MECRQCRTDNPASFRHCGACGLRLPATPCDQCGFSTPAPFLFCGNCGTSLDLQRNVQPEERRFATVVFADVVGFTTLADDTDPEDTARIIDTAFRRLSDVVHAHGGTIDKYIGDSLMAVFGIPTAHEDDAERAVAAALAMQRAETGLGFAIGVNTGEVMVTALGGGSVTVMGDTVNVASRLEKAANVGEVLVGPITFELTSTRINYRERPAMTLKGKRDAVEVHQAVSVRTNPVMSNTPMVPMVGRVEELDFLNSQLRRAANVKRLALVLLNGDAGIGKTRLLDELVERVGHEALVVRSSYPPYGGAGGARVGGDLLAQLGPSSDDAVQRRIRTLAGDIDPTLRNMEPAALRKEQLWALRRLAEDRAKDQPILVIIEDVHMASTSIDLLTGFAAQVNDLPMMLVLSGRPEGKWLSSFPTASTVRVRALGIEGSRRLAMQWQEGVPDDGLLNWAGGNPLFLRELLAFASHFGPDAPERQQLPMSLRGVLSARLDTLNHAERSALQDFAVIGDNATVEQLVALGGPAAADGVAGLTNAGLIRHRPDGTLRITEPLLREVAYEAMPRVSRSERHLRMADVVTSLDDRARHMIRGSEHAPDDDALRLRASEVAAEAGLAALDQSRRGEGIASLRTAVELGDHRPQTLLRLAGALNDSDPAEVLRLLTLFPEPSDDPHNDAERILVRANALVNTEPSVAFDHFDEAASRFHDLGDHSQEGWSHSNKGVALFMNGQLTEADDELVRALELFKAERNKTGEYATVSFRSLVRPDHPDVETWLQESLMFAIELGDRSRRLAALSSLQWHHYLSTRLAGPEHTSVARSWIDEHIDLARELGWPDFSLQGLCLRANLDRNAGDFASARIAVDEARELSGHVSDGERSMLTAIEASLDPGRPFRTYVGSDPFSLMARWLQAENALMEGRFDELSYGGRAMREFTGERRQLMVGAVPMALGFVLTGDLKTAASITDKLLGSPWSARATIPHTAAQALLAECRVRNGKSFEFTPPAEPFGGLAGLVIDRALAWNGDDDARERAHEFARSIRAPGLTADL